jgi:uncharacterized protein YjbJ (UPF0337 family)
MRLRDRTRREPVMGWVDKLKNRRNRAKGASKDHIGRATHNENMEREGKTDQRVSKLKQAGEKVKDAFKKD